MKTLARFVSILLVLVLLLGVLSLNAYADPSDDGEPDADEESAADVSGDRSAGDRGPGGGPGGPPGGPDYSITEYKDANNNEVKADPKKAKEGKEVKLTVHAKDGYACSSITVTNDDTNASVDYTPSFSGTVTEYRFNMPAANVTVSASFIAVPSIQVPTNPGPGPGGGPAPHAGPDGVYPLAVEGKVGEAYSCTFSLVNPSVSASWSCTGTLPQGITFNAATATLSGTPMAKGDYVITLTASNSDGSDTKKFKLKINPNPEKVIITFEANGGSGSMDNVIINKDSSYQLPACGFGYPDNKAFDKWEIKTGPGAPDTSYGKPSESITLKKDATIKPLWKDAVSVTVTVTPTGAGTALLDPPAVGEGDLLTLTKTENSGYRFKQWTITAGGVVFYNTTSTTSTDDSPSIEIGTASVEISAEFEHINYNVIVEASPSGGGTVAANPASEIMGENVALTATPASGYSFVKWEAGSGATGTLTNADSPNATYTIGTSDDTITATFEKDPVYSVTQGEDSVWTKGSNKVLEMKVERDPDNAACFGLFASLEIGGKKLTEGTDYDAESGSVILKIKPATLETFAVGTHTVTVRFGDGVVSTKLTIKAEVPKDVTPMTGEEWSPLWVILMAVSGLGLGVMIVRGNRRRTAEKK